MKNEFRKRFDLNLRVSVPEITFPDYEETIEKYVVFWFLGSSVRVIGYFDSYREALDKACDYEIEFKRQCRITRVKLIVQSL